MISPLHDLTFYKVYWLAAEWRGLHQQSLSAGTAALLPPKEAVLPGSQPLVSNSVSSSCDRTNIVVFKSQFGLGIKSASAFMGKGGKGRGDFVGMSKVDSFTDASCWGEEGELSQKYFCWRKEGGSASARTRS